jgi:dihydroorotase
MNCILRGVRVIDPLARLDATGQDVWICDGRIVAIYRNIGEGMAPVVDLTPPPGRSPLILCPGFFDLHAHLREPGNERAETIMSGGAAAAAGGFTQVLAMANTDPPVDTPERVARACFRAVSSPVQILTAAALTHNLEGQELVDIAACAAAGAVAFSDDGRNAASPRLLAQALRSADEVGRSVLLHPENEERIAQVNGVTGLTTRCVDRPPAAETDAVDFGIRALAHAGAGRLHLQHLTTAESVQMLRRARDEHSGLTAEVTPHHLAMWLPLDEELDPPGLAKVNPPLRTEQDREALIQALRDGVIDAVATDHAPHVPADKLGAYETAAAGIAGLETALATCITLGGMDGAWLPVLIERLTAGPYRVLGEAAGVREPRLRIGEAATCVLFDPDARWVVGQEPFRSRSRNNPLLGVVLHGRVVLTIVDGAVVHHDTSRLQLPLAATAGIDA